MSRRRWSWSEVGAVTGAGADPRDAARRGACSSDLAGRRHPDRRRARRPRSRRGSASSLCSSWCGRTFPAPTCVHPTSSAVHPSRCSPSRWPWWLRPSSWRSSARTCRGRVDLRSGLAVMACASVAVPLGIVLLNGVGVNDRATDRAPSFVAADAASSLVTGIGAVIAFAAVALIVVLWRVERPAARCRDGDLLCAAARVPDRRHDRSTRSSRAGRARHAAIHRWSDDADGGRHDGHVGHRGDPDAAGRRCGRRRCHRRRRRRGNPRALRRTPPPCRERGGSGGRVLADRHDRHRRRRCCALRPRPSGSPAWPSGCAAGVQQGCRRSRGCWPPSSPSPGCLRCGPRSAGRGNGRACSVPSRAAPSSCRSVRCCRRWLPWCSSSTDRSSGPAGSTRWPPTGCRAGHCGPRTGPTWCCQRQPQSSGWP